MCLLLDPDLYIWIRIWMGLAIDLEHLTLHHDHERGVHLI